MNLDRARDKGELSLEEWEKYQQRLEALKIKSAELSSTFPTKEVSPDPEIKETLIAELDVFNEELYKPKELIGSK